MNFYLDYCFHGVGSNMKTGKMNRKMKERSLGRILLCKQANVQITMDPIARLSLHRNLYIGLLAQEYSAQASFLRPPIRFFRLRLARLIKSDILSSSLSTDYLSSVLFYFFRLVSESIFLSFVPNLLALRHEFLSFHLQM